MLDDASVDLFARRIVGGEDGRDGSVDLLVYDSFLSRGGEANA